MENSVMKAGYVMLAVGHLQSVERITYGDLATAIGYPLARVGTSQFGQIMEATAIIYPDTIAKVYNKATGEWNNGTPSKAARIMYGQVEDPDPWLAFAAARVEA